MPVSDIASFPLSGCAVEARSLATPGTGPEAAAFNFLLSVDAMAHMANVLGLKEDYASYTELSTKLRPVFHRRFYNASSGTYGQRALEIQTLTAAPLALDSGYPALNGGSASGHTPKRLAKRIIWIEC